MKTNIIINTSRATLVCLIALGLVHCGGYETPEPQAFEALSCVSAGQCQNNVLAPLCADKLKGRCVGPENDKECLYPLRIATEGCLCIAGEARLCDLGDGQLGVEICGVVTSKPPVTEWTKCQPLNAEP